MSIVESIELATEDKINLDKDFFNACYYIAEKLFLKKSLTNKNPFEKNHVDVFVASTLDVGHIKKIR